jgi:hypothetical protein
MAAPPNDVLVAGCIAGPWANPLGALETRADSGDHMVRQEQSNSDAQTNSPRRLSRRAGATSAVGVNRGLVIALVGGMAYYLNEGLFP